MAAAKPQALQAFGQAQAPTPALKARPAFAFEMNSLAWLKVRKVDCTVTKNQIYT